MKLRDYVSKVSAFETNSLKDFEDYWENLCRNGSRVASSDMTVAEWEEWLKWYRLNYVEILHLPIPYIAKGDK